MLEQRLYEYLDDIENPETNFNLAIEYFNIGQTAAAVSFFLRAADRSGEDYDLAYECLIYIGDCFDIQNNRTTHAHGAYKQAISILPKRPEAYLSICRLKNWHSLYDDGYSYSSLALDVCDFENLNPLRKHKNYTGKHCLLFEKALSSWHWGKLSECKDGFADLYKNHWSKLTEYQKGISQKYLKEHYDISIEDLEKEFKPKIIDCFRFFNEKELLELRYNLLKDYVDNFVVIEGNKTQSGNDWKPLGKKYLEELDIPSDKFIFVETNLPGNDEDILNNDEDIAFRSLSGKSNDTYKNSLNARTRERLSLDSILSITESFSDKDIFFVSDCDEIIKPDFIEYFSKVASENPNSLLKVPLIELQGKANLRAYHKKTDLPMSTDNVFFVCTKKHFEKCTPFKMRFDIDNYFQTIYITQDGNRLEECGWHFSWMGDSERLKLKQKSTSHYADQIESCLIKDMSSKDLENFIQNWSPNEEGLNPWGNTDIVLKEYPVENLPKQILESEHLKNFFFNDAKKIPVIGVPVVNGVHWLKRLIDSIDYPVDELFIINNNGRGELDDELNEIIQSGNSYINKIKLTNLPANLGCSGAWNLIIKCYMNSPYWIIANNDICFTPGMLEKMHLEATQTDYGMIHAKSSDWGGGSYDLFLIKDWVVQKCGLFDENLYPIYAEDVDYHIRLINENISCRYLGLDYLHGEKDYATSGSQTWRIDTSLKDKMNNGRILNETTYLNKKWGDNYQSLNTYSKPFNNETYDSRYTTYDLEFVRKKHLGF